MEDPDQPTMVSGIVREWHDDDGWGVLDSAQTAGGCWVHFSQIDVRGLRVLEVGQQARFSFERASQDGFEWRAIRVRPAGTDPAPASERPLKGPNEAYGSALTIWFDKKLRRKRPRRR